MVGRGSPQELRRNWYKREDVIAVTKMPIEWLMHTALTNYRLHGDEMKVLAF
jgi:hypothetical protein